MVRKVGGWRGCSQLESVERRMHCTTFHAVSPTWEISVITPTDLVQHRRYVMTRVSATGQLKARHEEAHIFTLLTFDATLKLCVGESLSSIAPLQVAIQSRG